MSHRYTIHSWFVLGGLYADTRTSNIHVDELWICDRRYEDYEILDHYQNSRVCLPGVPRQLPPNPPPTRFQGSSRLPAATEAAQVRRGYNVGPCASAGGDWGTERTATVHRLDAGPERNAPSIVCPFEHCAPGTLCPRNTVPPEHCAPGTLGSCLAYLQVKPYIRELFPALGGPRGGLNVTLLGEGFDTSSPNIFVLLGGMVLRPCCGMWALGAWGRGYERGR